MNQYPPQIPNPQFNPQPPRKNRSWLPWTIGGAGFVLLAVLMILAAQKVGNGFGKLVNNGMQKQMALEDESFIDNLDQYDRIYAMLGTDPQSLELKEKLDSMRGRSHEIYTFINNVRDGFWDTVRTVNPGFVDRQISREYFINSGRASQIQKKVFAFYMFSFDNAPAELRADLILQDNLAAQQSVISPNSISYRDWANFKFNQPWQAARITLRNIKIEVRNYESDLLTRYEQLVPKQAPDSVH